MQYDHFYIVIKNNEISFNRHEYLQNISLSAYKKVLRKSSRDEKDFHLIYNRYFVYFVFVIEVF